MAGEIRWEPAMRDLAATVAHVAATGPVGTVGYCFGGSLAWLAANELPVAAAVGYYGGQIHSLNDRDAGGPDDAALRRARPRHPARSGRRDRQPPTRTSTVHVYEGAQHGFSCDARGSYHPLSAAIALGRTLEFFVANGVRP